MARTARLTPEERKANKRANALRYMKQYAGVAHVMPEEAKQPPPPRYVLREREIRRQIPPASLGAKALGDPLPGYSGKDNKARRLSVQDALEICALHNGGRGEILALAKTYGVGSHTIDEILSGRWFDQLLPTKFRFREGQE